MRGLRLVQPWSVGWRVLLLLAEGAAVVGLVVWFLALYIQNGSDCGGNAC